MFGIGTIVNAAAIIAGGVIGLFLKNILKDNVQDSIMKATGLAVLFIAITGCVKSMFIIENGTISTTGEMMAIISLSVGTILGELLNLEHRIETFGEFLKEKTGNEKDNQFIFAFVTASLTVCIGAMAVVGAINDGIYHEPSVLYAKAILDFIIIMVMASSLGKGAIFSFIPVFIFQFSITILATLLEPLMTNTALQNLSIVGNMLIFCVGVNLIWDKMFRVANMLPSIFIALLFALF